MNLVFMHNDQPCTNSRLVAWRFNKEHKHVMRDIRELECSEEFRQSNFGLSSYLNEQNREMPEYIITQDGFTFLVMGFTGKEAAAFKEEYINSFNGMRKQLEQPKSKEQLWLEAMRTLSEEVEVQKGLLDRARAQILKDRPKVDLYDVAMDSDGLLSIGQVAKVLQLPFGRNTLFKKLREKGIFFKSKNEPKQLYINNDCFVVKQKPFKVNEDKTVINLQVYVTQKGLSYINKLFGTGETVPIIKAKIN